jgi:aspartyl-tRNA(Asn)/glutamyl-tRNA(Gln) amidotransferase subunit B
MGYQITQLYHPTNIDGEVEFFIDSQYEESRKVSIRDAHLENDTAKMIHLENEALLDFNRAGTPLVEIVTWPDFSSALEVSEFLKELQRRARYNDISDADMDKGQMRIDVNISVRKEEKDPLWTRVELKNINSFGMVRRAIEQEFERQKKTLESGEKIYQETRTRDDQKGESFSMRSKEEALDYRYFPEPDLPPLQIDNETKKKIAEIDFEIPYELIKLFKKWFWFHKEFINPLIWNKSILEYFMKTLVTLSSISRKELCNYNISSEEHKASKKAKLIAKRISWPIAAYLNQKESSLESLPFSQDQFLSFLKLCEAEKLGENQLKVIMEEMLKNWRDVEKIVEEKWFSNTEFDESLLNEIIKKILADNPTIVEQYKWWKTTTIAFFLGQVMKATGGKVKPQQAQEKIEKFLTFNP